MPVLKPKVRMVSLRLSEDEYAALVKLSLSEGLRSTSDAARAAVCHYVADHEPGDRRTEIQKKIDGLESEVQRLGKILDGLAILAKG